MLNKIVLSGTVLTVRPVLKILALLVYIICYYIYHILYISLAAKESLVTVGDKPSMNCNMDFASFLCI